MKCIIVVGVVPVDRTRRDETVLIGGGDIVQCFDYRFAHLRIVGMKPPVLGDDILSAISDQKVIEKGVWIDTVGRHLKSNAVHPACALGPQLFLHLLEEIVVGVPGIWNFLHLEAGLFNQWLPD